MAREKFITEEEYDRLPPQTQRQYRYCLVCNIFYLKNLGICDHRNAKKQVV